MKRKTFSVRFTVGTMFVVATLITGLVAVSLQYHFSKKMAAFKSVSLGQTDALLDVKLVLISGLSQYFYKNLKFHGDIIDLAEQFSSAFST